MPRASWWRRLTGPTQGLDSGPATVRYAEPEDEDAIVRLAQLDSSRPPRGAVLLAEVGGEAWAAVSLDDGHAVADPFRPTGELVMRLHDAARRVRREQRGRMHRLPRVWPAAPAA